MRAHAPTLALGGLPVLLKALDSPPKERTTIVRLLVLPVGLTGSFPDPYRPAVWATELQEAVGELLVSSTRMRGTNQYRISTWYNGTYHPLQQFLSIIVVSD